MYAHYTRGVLLLRQQRGGKVVMLATVPVRHTVTGILWFTPRIVVIADGPDVLICVCGEDGDWARAGLRRVQVGLADDPSAEQLPRPMAVWDETVVVADFGVLLMSST